MTDWNKWSDQWRADYRAMDYAEQQRRTDAILAAHPKQAGFDPDAFDECMALIPAPSLDVIEFGGWRGGLAAHALALHPRIQRWTNCELSKLAAESPECTDPRYEVFIPNDFLWELEPPAGHYNTFVSSHAIEHITGVHLSTLFFSWLPETIRWIWLQAPLPESATDNKWENYGGTHILEVGHAEIAKSLGLMGFDREWECGIRGEVRFFARR